MGIDDAPQIELCRLVGLHWAMKVKVVVHEVPEAEGVGYWAEVPALPGCFTQGDSRDEVMANLRDVVEG
jgi:predicted RNase H-like HicB family nuclease